MTIADGFRFGVGLILSGMAAAAFSAFLVGVLALTLAAIDVVRKK